MRPEDLDVALRPRSSWEAIELGTALLRRHAGAVWRPWLLATLPLFALLNAAAWALDQQLAGWLPGRALAIQIVRVGVTIAGALGVLALALHVLRVREFTDVVAAVAARLRRGRARGPAGSPPAG